VPKSKKLVNQIRYHRYAPPSAPLFFYDQESSFEQANDRPTKSQDQDNEEAIPFVRFEFIAELVFFSPREAER